MKRRLDTADQGLLAFFITIVIFLLFAVIVHPNRVKMIGF